MVDEYELPLRMRLDEAVRGERVDDAAHRRSGHDRCRHAERGCSEASTFEHLAAVDDHLAPLVGVHALRLWSAEVFRLH
jgi:hypothetical protein